LNICLDRAEEEEEENEEEEEVISTAGALDETSNHSKVGTQSTHSLTC